MSDEHGNEKMGMNFAIGADLVAHCNTPPEPGNEIMHDAKLWEKHYHPEWTSSEGDGKSFKGREEHLKKYEEWMGFHTVHSFKALEMFAGARGFTVLFEMDVEAKDGSFPRQVMREVGVYTVENGKIVREEFMYGPMDFGEGN